jgi:hypothetical protein
VVTLVAVGFVAGCTTSEAGTATPGATTDSSSTSESQPPESSPQSSVEIPPPPRDLSLDGVDPCTLVTEAQQAELKITDVNPGVGESSIYKDMKECTLDADGGEPFISYNLVAVTNLDVGYWINEPHNAEVRLISIESYPAAEFNIIGGRDVDCAIALGVAKNQFLYVKMEPFEGEFTGEQLCQGGQRVAAMALQTLQTMR